MKSVRIAIIVSAILAMTVSERTILASASSRNTVPSTTLSMRQLPLIFEANRGQTDRQV